MNERMKKTYETPSLSLLKTDVEHDMLAGSDKLTVSSDSANKKYQVLSNIQEWMEEEE